MGPSQVARHIMDNEDKLHDLQTKMLDTKSMLNLNQNYGRKIEKSIIFTISEAYLILHN